YPELRECGRNYQSDRCIDLICQSDGRRSSAMSQQDGNTSENQRTEMLDSLFHFPRIGIVMARSRQSHEVLGSGTARSTLDVPKKTFGLHELFGIEANPRSVSWPRWKSS